MPPDPLQSLAAEIARRPPRPDAQRALRISTPRADRPDRSWVRLSGPRADVLDYASALLSADRDRTGQPTSALRAIEREDDRELTIVIERRG